LESLQVDLKMVSRACSILMKPLVLVLVDILFRTVNGD
jgi:hypothetical protein